MDPMAAMIRADTMGLITRLSIGEEISIPVGDPEPPPYWVTLPKESIETKPN